MARHGHGICFNAGMTPNDAAGLEQLSRILSERLSERSDALVERWIDWLGTRAPTRTTSALDREALRDHIPPVLRSLCDYIYEPLDLVRQEMLDNLRIHAEVRRDQGYDVQELLAEFDGLSHVFSGAALEEIERLEAPASAVAAARLLERVGQGLRAIGFVTVYRCGESIPLASNLNFVAGETVANAVLAPVDADGDICIVSLVDTHLVVDVNAARQG